MRIGQLPGEEGFLVGEFLHRVAAEAPALVERQGVGAGENVVIAPLPLRHLSGRIIGLLPVAGDVADEAIGLAVIQRF